MHTSRKLQFALVLSGTAWIALAPPSAAQAAGRQDPPAAPAAVTSKLLRQPDINKTQIVFVYGGDLWTVPRSGGLARRITANPSIKRNPKFSPDGSQIAFTGNYDGNSDVYTIPADGGEPKRLTYHPMPDLVEGWTPDGKAILFRSNRTSFSYRFNKLFTVPVNGGMEKELPLPEAGLASFSPDGTKLAYNRIEREGATWKRYRGGEQAYVSIYDMANNKYSELPHADETDFYPMWHGRKIYFASDRPGTVNLFSYDLDTRALKQLTRYTDYDVKSPSLGSDAIVFELGGVLTIFDLKTEKTTPVPITVRSDSAATRPTLRRVEGSITGYGLSPTGARAVFEAHGELFTVPSKKGETRNVTNTSGVREKTPAWSPDGKTIAYFSDKSGEYEIYIRPQDGTGTETRVTFDGKVDRDSLAWTPDSKTLIYSDVALHLWMISLADKKPVLIDSSKIGDVVFGDVSSDSSWIAYTKPNPSGLSSIYLYSIPKRKAYEVSSGKFNDNNPVFDLNGKYLYFTSDRSFTPAIAGPEINFSFQNTTGLYALILANDTPSPLAPESDEEKPKEDAPAPMPPAPNPMPAKPGSGPPSPAPNKPAPDPIKPGAPDAKAAPADAVKTAAPAAAPAKPAMKIDFDGLYNRVIALPGIRPGSYAGLIGGSNKVIYTTQGSVHVLDMASKSDATIISGVQGYTVNPTVTKMLYQSGPVYGIIDVAPGQSVGAGQLTLALEARIDPRQEWKQEFQEAWRYERDYYYDPNMHGLDWKAIGARYAALVPSISHPDDLTYLLGELIGELNTSHAYVVPAPNPAARAISGGLLGCDFEAAGAYYRIKKIYAGENWQEDRRAPLTEPGVNVKTGDYILSVNGVPLRADTNPYAPFENTVGKTVTLLVNDKPSETGGRTVLVRPVASEGNLRYLDWVETNRKKVEAATGGLCGYVQVPDTSVPGMTEFGRGFYSQTDKKAMIVDERFNSGGFIPDFFVEKLSRKLLSQATPRYGQDFKNPGGAIYGPKVILANEWSGSGGDAFPYFFRKAGVGPIVGKRTWGGLVGISGFRSLLDGGGVTVPQFGIWSPQDNKWIAENHGIDPDFEVNNTPDVMQNGRDPQLDRAIAYILEQLKKNPPKDYQHPPYPVEKLSSSVAVRK